MLKALNPVVTMVFTMAMGIEQVKSTTIFPILGVTVGIMFTAIVETSGPKFSWWGVFLFLLSVVMDAARFTLSDKIVNSSGLDSTTALYYISILCSVTLGFAALAVDILPAGGGARIAQAAQLCVDHPWIYTFAMVLGVLVQLTGLWAIQQVGSLTVKTVACVRNAFVVLAAVILYGERVTFLQFCGYGFALSCFVYYTQEKAKTAAAAARKESSKV